MKMRVRIEIELLVVTLKYQLRKISFHFLSVKKLKKLKMKKNQREDVKYFEKIFL